MEVDSQIPITVYEIDKEKKTLQRFKAIKFQTYYICFSTADTVVSL